MRPSAKCGSGSTSGIVISMIHHLLSDLPMKIKEELIKHMASHLATTYDLDLQEGYKQARRASLKQLVHFYVISPPADEEDAQPVLFDVWYTCGRVEDTRPCYKWNPTYEFAKECLRLFARSRHKESFVFSEEADKAVLYNLKNQDHVGIALKDFKDATA